MNLSIYDVEGRLIRTLVNELKVSGSYAEEWGGRNYDGARVPPGLYFCYIKAGCYSATRKLVLLK